MTIEKLTKADIPMCPKCGYELAVLEWRGNLPPKCLCGLCDTKTDNPDWGYYKYRLKEQ